MSKYQTPGVYKEESILASAAPLQTGVPGFVGLIKAESKLADRLSQPVLLNRKSEFDTLFDNQPEIHLVAGSFLSEAVSGFFLNGGARCYVVCGRSEDEDIADTGSKEKALEKALQTLSPLTDLDLIAIPDAMTLTVEAAKRVQSEMLRHCEVQGNRLAILDALPGTTVDDVIRQRRDITMGLDEPINGALYYPWLKIDKGQLVPPSGHVAGIYSRSDARIGVFKAPANEEVLGALDLGITNESSTIVDNQVQDRLNPEGINCLRAFRGRGIRVWGARTLSRDTEWRYINVRRLVLTLHRWIEFNMAWASFEPNTPQLWVRIKRELNVYLTELWQAGALAGQKAEEAFFVKCDSETNPPELRESGQSVTLIGLAPGRPAEFLIVRIVHHTGVEPR
jgi:phage tail sheath protein FI